MSYNDCDLIWNCDSIRKSKKKHSKIQTVLALAILLLSGAAEAENPGTMKVVNREEIPIKIDVVPMIHCYRADEVTGQVILPNDSFEWGFRHSGPWRGCGGAMGKFGIRFERGDDKKSKEKEFAIFIFDRTTSCTEEPGGFPGDFQAKGSKRTFKTKAGWTSSAELFEKNAQIIVSHDNGSGYSTGKTSDSNSSFVATMNSDSLRLLSKSHVDYEGALGFSSDLEAEIQKKFSKETRVAQGSARANEVYKVLKEGTMRLGILQADIMRSPKGSYFLKYDPKPKIEYIEKPQKEAALILAHGGNTYYSLSVAIGLYDGVKLENLPGKGKLMKIVAQ